MKEVDVSHRLPGPNARIGKSGGVRELRRWSNSSMMVALFLSA
jgi:hypothetical protein